MTLQENVEKSIRHGRSVIKKSEPDYNLNETSTCYAIIDPILRALGWKLDDPGQCRFEEWQKREGQQASGRTDYSLYKGDKLVVLIEAKALSKTLNGFSEENQLKNYRADPDVWVLTNGSHWYFYKSMKEFGKNRFPDINIEYGTMADIEDEKTGRKAMVAEMAQEMIKHLGYRRL